jgi:hypothetical protein
LRAASSGTEGNEKSVPLTGSALTPTPEGTSGSSAASAPQTAESDPESQSRAYAAIGPNSQTSAPGQASPDFSQSVLFELANAVSNSSKAVTLQVKDSKLPPAETSSTLQPSRAASSATAGNEESVPLTDPALTPMPERMEALHTTRVSRLGNESQAARTETPVSLPQEQTRLKPQVLSGGSAASALQSAESSPESQSRVQAAPGPKAPISTPSQSSPDFSLPTQVESTEAVSGGQANEAQNSDRIKNSQAGNRTASGADSEAGPGGTSASLAMQSDNTDGIDAEPLVDDTRQAGAFAEERGSNAAQDLTKAAGEKEGLSKADADPPLAQRLVPPGTAEGGSAFPVTTGASRSRGQADSAGVSASSQINAGGIVSSARFAQQAGNAEMQVRLRSEALGPIAVHTIAKGSDIGASIRVEARDTQVLLANELSQLERALNERNLRVERLDVLQVSPSGGQSDGTASGNYHGNPSESRQRFSSYFSGQTYTPLPEAPTVSEDWGLGLSSNRINLRV